MSYFLDHFDFSQLTDNCYIMHIYMQSNNYHMQYTVNENDVGNRDLTYCISVNKYGEYICHGLDYSSPMLTYTVNKKLKDIILNGRIRPSSRVAILKTLTYEM